MKYSSYGCQGAAPISSPRQISISFLTMTLFLGAKHVQKAQKNVFSSQLDIILPLYL